MCAVCITFRQTHIDIANVRVPSNSSHVGKCEIPQVFPWADWKSRVENVFSAKKDINIHALHRKKGLRL